MTEKDLFGRAKEIDELTKRGLQIAYGMGGPDDASATFEWQFYLTELRQDPDLGRAVCENFELRVIEAEGIITKYNNGEELSPREIEIIKKFADDANPVE